MNEPNETTTPEVETVDVGGVEVPHDAYIEALETGSADELLAAARDGGDLSKWQTGDELEDELEDGASDEEADDELEDDEEAEDGPEGDKDPDAGGEAEGAGDGASGGLTEAQRSHAAKWLLRTGAQLGQVEELLSKSPETALAVAGFVKDAQDQLLRSRAGSTGDLEDADRPSMSDPAADAGSPDEDRRTAALELVKREFGSEATEALLELLRPSGDGETGGGPSDDSAALAAEVSRVRDRLVDQGHDQLSDPAELQAVLEAADRLQAIDADLSVEAAITEATETRKARKKARKARTRTRRETLDSTQLLNPDERPTRRKLSRDDAHTRFIELLEAGKRDQAMRLKARHKL